MVHSSGCVALLAFEICEYHSRYDAFKLLESHREPRHAHGLLAQKRSALESFSENSC